MTVLHQDIGHSVPGKTVSGPSHTDPMKQSAQEPRERRDWVNTISLEHVRRGIAGGFTQADHGRSTRLSQLRQGDRIVFYSPRTDYPGGEPLQQFTACGTVVGNEVYQVQLAPDFRPWRRDVQFAACVPADIRPLLSELSFVLAGRNWGFTFRRGLFQIPSEDFDRILTAMGANVMAT